jgi:carboxylesterase
LITAGAEVRSRLGEVIAPALIITSRQDHVVNPEDSDVLAAELGGPVERLWLEKSFHVATVDYDKAEVEAAAVAFATRVTSG